MRLFKSDLQSLMAKHDEPCVSIFLPVHGLGDDTRQNAIRYKNLLRKAEDMLVQHGLRRGNAEIMLADAAAILNDMAFWQVRGHGMAVFKSPEFFKYYVLPIAFDDLVTVCESFHVKPLIPLLAGDNEFYVLSLSLNVVRLLRCTRYSVAEVALNHDVPHSLHEALRFDVTEESLQFHTHTPVRDGNRSAMFHSQGEGVDEAVKKRKVMDFFQRLDRGLRKKLNGTEATLVLAAVEKDQAMYRQANSYPHLLDGGIAGSAEAMSDQEIHERAWQLMQPVFDRTRRRAHDAYAMLTSGGRATSDIHRIVPAAYHGHVSVLFAAGNRHLWGRFDPTRSHVDLHGRQLPGDRDLLDAAAASTLLHGGSVYVVDVDQVPQQQTVAAIMRPNGFAAPSGPQKA